MPARIEPARPPFPEAIQGQLDRLMPPGVPPLTLFTTLARDERLFWRFMGGGLLDRGHLTLRQREIVIGRVTAQKGSEYEWGVHAAFFSERAGLTEEQLHALVYRGPGVACWTDEEKLLLRLCDELHLHADVSEGLWGALTDAYTENAILELLLLAGFYRTVAYLTNALRLSREPLGGYFPSP